MNEIWNRIRTAPRTRRRLLPLLGGVALLGIGGAALAKPAITVPAADGKRGGLCARLECTETQKQELRAVMSELRADTKGDRQAIKRLHKQLAAEFAKDKPDEAAMRSIQAQIATHHGEMQARGLDAMMEVHELLDAEQRAKLAPMIEHRGLRGMMRGKGKRGDGKRGDGKRGDGKRKRQAAG